MTCNTCDGSGQYRPPYEKDFIDCPECVCKAVFTIRLPEVTDQLLKDLIDDLENEQKITLSKNKMIIRLIEKESEKNDKAKS